MIQRAPEASTLTHRNGLQRALLLIAAVSAFIMPSTYRGGAELPHPHGLFQFWLSGPETAFDHHRANHDHGDALAHSMHGNTDHESQTSYMTDATAAKSIEVDRDTPSVSPADAPGGMVSSLAMVTGVVLAIGASIVRKIEFPSLTRSWNGRAIAPATPPPRALVLV